MRDCLVTSIYETPTTSNFWMVPINNYDCVVEETPDGDWIVKRHNIDGGWEDGVPDEVDRERIVKAAKFRKKKYRRECGRT